MEHRHEASYRHPMSMANGVQRGTCVCGTPVTRPIGTGVTPAGNDALWVALVQLGDQVRTHDGVRGHLSAVKGMGLFVETTTDDALHGPYAPSQVAAVALCEWFLTCPNEATEVAEDTTWGPVPVCGPCLKFANPDKALY